METAIFDDCFVTTQLLCVQGGWRDNACLTPTSILSLEDALDSTGSNHGAEGTAAVQGHSAKLKAHPLSSFGSDVSEDSSHSVHWDGKASPLLLVIPADNTCQDSKCFLSLHRVPTS